MNSYQIPSMYLFSLEEILYIVVDAFGELTIYLNEGESLEPIDFAESYQELSDRGYHFLTTLF